MSDQWKKCLLGNLVELKRGYDLPTSSRTPGDYPIVSSSGVSGTHVEAKVKAPGVVTGRYGTLGQVFYIKEDFWPLNTSLYVRDFKGNHPKFIAYFLGSLGLASSNAAGAVPGLNRNHLHQLEVSAPDYVVQEKVAAFLSAYDDLIENNTRRIEILEEMARRLYEEWFVHFRFPGHEAVSFKDSELGKIPEGWDVVQLKDIVNNFDRKRKPLSKKQRSERQGDYPYYGAAKIFDYIDDYLFDGRYLLLAEDGSVIDKDGYPVLQIANGKFWANNHTHILQGKHPVSTEFLCLALSRHPISGYITGAAQPKITQENMNRIPLIIGALETHAAFDKLIKPMFDMQETLVKKNTNLRAQRDLLLPKLVSGEIDVSNISLPDDKEVEVA
ncbi:restriction endonuclease subunit S [Ectothiorhodospira haloalkaliphila]|uniref:restriction endonuclease subunit S n=1 Tax=Ectothiorhodospira haloalkaliphila TaxID=421628 RepID=UPI0006865363|nr:restriction endonuclease subunit S [Ectothiorhodospira haloalkaliphila]